MHLGLGQHLARRAEPGGDPGQRQVFHHQITVVGGADARGPQSELRRGFARCANTGQQLGQGHGSSSATSFDPSSTPPNRVKIRVKDSAFTPGWPMLSRS
jgi:hypothetical protein